MPDVAYAGFPPARDDNYGSHAKTPAQAAGSQAICSLAYPAIKSRDDASLIYFVEAGHLVVAEVLHARMEPDSHLATGTDTAFGSRNFL